MGLDPVHRVHPSSVDLTPVDRVLVLLWISWGALAACGVLEDGEVRGRWYPCSQDCPSILGCSTQRLFSTTIIFNELVFPPSVLCGEVWVRMSKWKAYQEQQEVYTYLDRSTITATLIFGKVACGLFLTPCASQNYFLDR